MTVMLRMAWAGLIGLAVLVTGLAACSLDESERCTEIEAILEARGQQLPKGCEADTDCLIVEVRPGIPAVTNRPFDPMSVRSLVVEYETSCGAFDQRYRAARPLCEQRGVNRICELQVESIYLDQDAGPAVETFDCDCETDADCGAAAPRCESCVCRDDCGVACSRLYACGELQDSGLGLSIADCTTHCNDSADTDAGATLAQCLSQTECAFIQTCFP